MQSFFVVCYNKELKSKVRIENKTKNPLDSVNENIDKFHTFHRRYLNAFAVIHDSSFVEMAVT